ncbi:MAG: hypothetical protein HPY64_15945 [Anaerolineae bacterium]|nr:hypothetical protein [Anaerolineae bacterium]
MRRAKPLIWLLLLTGGMALITLTLLVTAAPAAAQCGSSATSCKNCHEVNAEYPVNGSGDWHISHAFGDFCAFCHAGNIQATAMDAAHEGMVYPLADPQASCQACHPADYMDQAGIYAVALGVDLSAGVSGEASGGGGSASGGGGATTNPADIPPQPIAPPGERHASGALIDYNRRYEIEVLGKLDTSQVGNLILAVMAVLLLGVGAALVWRFEGLGEAWRRARAVPPESDWRRLAASGAYTGRMPLTAQMRAASVQVPVVVAPIAPTPVASPPAPVAPTAGVVDLDRLDAPTRRALETLLADSRHGGAILRALSRLDPALINSLSGLSRQDRMLLLAVVEQLGGESEA